MTCLPRYLWAVFSLTLAAALTTPTAEAQQNVPHVGYVYPAGGRQGETVRVTVGGQYLVQTTGVCVSGKGIQAKVVEVPKPLTPKEVEELRKKAEELQKKPKDAASRKELRDIRTRLLEFQNRRMNPALADKVALQITIDADAEPGQRELRLIAPNGLSNPLVFQIGELAEFRKAEAKPKLEAPNRKPPDPVNPKDSKPETETLALPTVVNGQIMPGGVDRYGFQARKGQRLVVVVSARELRPYLADAVPGWFQPAVTIRDSQGAELAFADHFRFHPDPVVYCKIPKSGQYVLEIRDTLYRGREDFVYRVAVGELPYLTDVFPLGCPVGEEATLELTGWNLRSNTLKVNTTGRAVGVRPIRVHHAKMASNRVPFAIGDMPECLEKEPNGEPATAQAIALPSIVNGRIDRPGDGDVFRIEGQAGQKIVAEVDARDLGSPLDSVLRLTDEKGRQLAYNDDYLNKDTGLLTHHADSLIAFALPADGSYYLHLADIEHKGGPAYAYRLRVSEPRPDFSLLVVPSSINVRAGAAVPITVYAVRKDGFADEIALLLKDAPTGFALNGAHVPAGQNQTQLTLTAPRTPSEEPIRLHIEGRAKIDGREIVRQAVPAEDMMQAFAYHHLVPAQELVVAVTGRERRLPAWKLVGAVPVKLPAGGTASVRFTLPRGPVLDQLRLTLHDPPAGIAIQDVSLTSDGATVVLSADVAKVKLGAKGNLIIDASVERTANPANGKKSANKRVIPLGSLPAVPYEIVAKGAAIK